MSDQEIISQRLLAFPRALVWQAWTDPALLAQWWGPRGFTNTFELFDLRAGGEWRFVMHGPDGRNYPNSSVFVEIAAPERIIFDHVSPPHFRVVATFAEQPTGTLATFRMIFATAELCVQLRALVVPANEENFDRLAALLGKKSGR